MRFGFHSGLCSTRSNPDLRAQLMTEGILFLIVPTSSLAKLEREINKWIVPRARGAVKVLSDATAASFSTDIGRNVAEELIDIISAHPRHQKNRLLIERDVNCSIANIIEWWNLSEHGKSDERKFTLKALLREVDEHLQRTRQHWKTHAQYEIARFEGKTLSLDAWLYQFIELGQADISRKISGQIRIVPTGDLARNAFALRASDVAGSRRANCYVKDDDAGGSWVEIQNILTHAFEPASVFPVTWSKTAGTMDFPEVEVDEFILHEDGLWSGSEAVRRLRAIKNAPPSAPVVFKYGVVSDFGIRVARQAIRSLGLKGLVSIDASASEEVAFLKNETLGALDLGLDVLPDAYFKSLHQHVQPLAFMPEGNWSDEERDVCRKIGEQLVTRWLKQKGDDPSDEAIARFSLGGGGFASTILFSRSIPKVCLPLLWLDGPVTLDGKTVNWRPLFIDSRRVTDLKLLLA